MTDEAALIILAAGGTGGHIFPAEALGDVLVARGYRVALVTDQRFHHYYNLSDDSLFARLPIHCIHAGNLSGGPVKKLLGGLNIVRGICQARHLLKSERPAAVIGFGGYPSYPTMMAASQLRIPTIIHEQNAILGRANARLVDRVNRIAASYPNTQKIPAHCGGKVVVTGNPVRAGIRALSHVPYNPPQPDGTLRLLITGGSQGAHIFSEVVPEAAARLPENLRERLRIDQQCREEQISDVRKRYKQLGLQADLAPFFRDMPARLASAHLVIARSGASTVAELSASGRPAILVPLPTAMDNHQYVNAQAIEDAEAGWVMAQHAFTPESLAARLESFLTLPSSLLNAAQRMQSLGRISAADDLASLSEQLILARPARKKALTQDKGKV